MKKTFIAILLLLGQTSTVFAREPLCVNALDAMPEGWRPPAEMRKTLSDKPWSATEAQDAQYAIATGIDEMLAHYATAPAKVTALKDDAVESLIDVTYSGGTGSPLVDQAARDGAYRNLEILIAPYLDRDTQSARCRDVEKVLPLAIYAHRFYPARDVRTAKLVAFANAANRACASFAKLVRHNYEAMLAGDELIAEDAFQLVAWSIVLTEAELVPGLDQSPEARAFSPSLWHYLERYPMVGANAYADGALNMAFLETGYLATHVAFIPTGYHRHPLYVEDSPRLYRFFRENFYALMAARRTDLAAQFLDAFRQYGCTEENDRQVRDGTRNLLEVFHAGHDRWMSYREPDEAAVVNDYELVHKPWSATIGLRRRTPEPAAPGTYGGVIRKWLPSPKRP